MATRGKQSSPKQPQGSVWPRTILYEGMGIVLISLAIFLLLTLLSFHPDDPSFNQTGGDTVRNAAGYFGAYLSDLLLQALGYAAGGLVVLCGMIGLHLFRDATLAHWDKMLAILVLTVGTAVLCTLLLDKGVGGALPSGPGGLLGLLGAETLRRALGPAGVLLLLIPLMLLALMVLIRFSLLAHWQAWLARWQRLRSGWGGQERDNTPPAEPVEPRVAPESRAEAKERRAVEAKKQAAAEQKVRAEEIARGRTETAQYRQQVGMDERLKREPTTFDGAAEHLDIEEIPVPRAGRPALWTRLRPLLEGSLRRGQEAGGRWLRRGWALLRQRLAGIRLDTLWTRRGAQSAGKEAEPEFFPLRTDSYREPTFDELSAPTRQAVTVPGEAVTPARGGEPDLRVQVWSSPLPVLPGGDVPSVGPKVPVPAQTVLSAPVIGEATAGPRPPSPEPRRETIKPQEPSWRPNPVVLWPEGPGKPVPPAAANVVVPPAEVDVVVPQVVPLAPARDLPSFEAFSQPAEDRQDLMRGLERAWESGSVEELSPLPPFSLLVDPGPRKAGGPTREELSEIARTLEQKLADFKIKGQIVDVLPGPVVTTFELDLAPGVRAAKVIGLSDDLARSISVTSVRVVGNVPGKTVIGIEIPNEVRQTVYLKEILSSEGFRKMGSPLAVALGSDIFGNPVSGNLAKMPHLLVAGTTGSGKSVAVNAMICSILFSARPDEVRFLMVDPKMLELSIYEGIPHLLAPVVTDVGKAANLLKWAVVEMENRYRLMSELGVRNLTGFNERIQHCIEHDEQPTRRVKIGIDPETGRIVEQEEPIPLDTKPLIVIVIDELADLMIQVGKEVEPAIARLAQMARAAGLHLILATQRPSVDVITGLIKANFPTRLAFQVSSKIDSRTILDAMGADRLLGMGDGLFLPPGTSHLQRIHAPFVSDREVHDLVKYLKSTGSPDYDHSVLMQRAGDGDEGDDGGFSGGAGGEEQDELYDQAVRIVLRERRVSTSLVQRIFKIGYNRAARIVEQMEAEGLVSAPNGAGKREVLAPEGGGM
ncbi:MAG: DNA translocase FtsK 4TM domain-containing protein [Magnetococcus sp. DMHC-8]